MYRDDREKEKIRERSGKFVPFNSKSINMKILKIVSLVKWKGSVVDWSKIFPI